MKLTNSNLFFHLDRLYIIQALLKDNLSSEELAREIKIIPRSSIYRHLDILHKARILKVVKKIKKRGAEEKYYQIRIQKIKNFLGGFKKEFDALLKFKS